MVSTEALQLIWDLYEEIPHSKDNVYGNVEREGQIALGMAFEKIGKKIYSLDKDYRTFFCRGDGNVVYFGGSDKEILMIPIQISQYFL